MENQVYLIMHSLSTMKLEKKTYLGFNITIKILNNEPQTTELEMGKDFKLEK
jgi:hypothetical protein